MSLSDTPRGERVHIALFGRRNAGKSSLINALTGQDISIVSDVAGTTTDPVFKAMELLPIGPVVIIDTPGLDDEGVLGSLRMERAKAVLEKTDVALIVMDSTAYLSDLEEDMIQQTKIRKIPAVFVLNKVDLRSLDKDLDKQVLQLSQDLELPVIHVSSTTKVGIDELKQALIQARPEQTHEQSLVKDLLSPSDTVILVVPVDSAAPKGRLILPQQQVIRDILDGDATAMVTQTAGLKNTLNSLKNPPKMVITDSQAFAAVAKDTPLSIPLTSFSILFARYKGDLNELVAGAKALDSLMDGDKVLIAEGCTHHRQCEDIGTVKLPRWIKDYTGKDLSFEFSSGAGYPSNLGDYQMVIHCGACMLNKREMQYRIRQAQDLAVPITNYGVLIAYMQGILPRVLAPFE